jgi:hypothetical protein
MLANQPKGPTGRPKNPSKSCGNRKEPVQHEIGCVELTLAGAQGLDGRGQPFFDEFGAFGGDAAQI